MNTPMQEFITILYRRPTDAAVPVRVVSFFDSLLGGHKKFSHEITNNCTCKNNVE